MRGQAEQRCALPAIILLSSVRNPASVFWKCRNPPQFCKHPHVCLARAHEWLINTEYVWRCLPDQGRTGKRFLDHWFICCNCGLKPFAAICEFVPKLGNYLSWENIFSAVLWIKTFLSVVNNKSLFPVWRDSSEKLQSTLFLGLYEKLWLYLMLFWFIFLRKYFVFPLKHFTQSK